ncbi:lipopolysaccharide biosynthesis protein [Salinibacterium sp. M195]|uniref:lipopolysaccharide biosynthesis protein n=1 Tax=Salinibacterium sp. M195 TaxID=2583374 RepID=UPI001C6333F0|nr:lipopolysaccharide biosynthesis protein [Salinibacterium sp. M195]QYH37260.1 lipopolysaccharide biosynthesis protein [Salinibacterium sp. M195]
MAHTSVNEQGPDDAVGRQTTSGVLWLTAQKWVIRLLGFVTIAVLTRLLSPEDFGTVAAASTILPFFYLLSDLGFAAYIVQVAKADQRMLSTAFWFSLSAGVVLGAVLFAIAPLAGILFANPEVVPVLRALSLWVIFTAFGSVPLAILRRTMRFRVLAGQGAIAAVIAQVVAMVMAFSGLGVWALVGQSLVAPAVTTVLAWTVIHWRPTLAFNRREFATMTRFGAKVLGVEFVAMLRASGEAAVISSTLGVAALGYMNIAQRLVQVVQDLTGSAIVPVTTVAFARIREDRERLLNAYLRALRMSYAALSLPLTIVAVAAPMIVPLLFGEAWATSYPIAQILAIAGTLTVGAWLDHGLFYGLGKPGKWFVYALVIDAVTLTTTILLVRFGLVAVAWGFLAVCVVATVSRWFLVSGELSAPVRKIASPFLFVVIAVVVSGAAGWGVMLLTRSLPDWASILVIAVTVSVVHLSVTRLIAPTVIAEGLAVLARSKWGKRIRFLRSGEDDA